MSEGKLPEEWINTEIGDIAEIISGGTPKSGNASNFAPTGEGIAWLTPADLSGYKKKCIARGARDLSIDGYSSCSAKLMRAGAILFSSRAPIGYVAVASNEIATNQGFKSFVFTDDIYSDYAYYYLRNIRHLAEEKGTGTTFKEISGSSAKTLPFVIAPLAEQKIIAEKLDTLLAQVDSTKARLEKIPKILKRFRQAVLSVAAEGKLTNSDTKNWVLTKVEDLVKIINGKSFPSTDYQKNGVKLLRPGNLHKSGEVIWTEKNTTYLPNDWAIKRPELSLKNGVLLMNLTAQSLKDEFLGRVCVLNKSDEVVLLNQRISAFISDVNYDVLPFLFIYFRSPQFRAYIDTLDSGTLIKHLNIKDIKSYSLKLPSAEEQREIVRRVEQLFAYADTIETQVNNALARVNNLTQSILAKAFRGELTAQWREENTQLISGENSAAALLEKIKAERAASTGKKASRKKS